MRVSELFEEESKKVPHGKVVDVLYSLALKYFKAPAAVKQDAQYLARSTDQFWSESFDDVTRQLQRFYDDAFAGVYNDYDFHGAVDNAVSDAVENMREFYSNRMNHPPGYQPPKFQDDNTPLEIPVSVIQKAFATIPNFAEAVKANAAALKTELAAKRKDAKDRMAAITPEAIQQLADLVDKHWNSSFGPAIQQKIAKNPKSYDFEAGFAPKSEEDIVKELIRTKEKKVTDLGTIAEWSWNDMGYDEMFKMSKHVSLGDVIRNDKLMRQIAAKSKHLSRYL